MPAIQNIGATDSSAVAKTFNAISGAGGSSPAIWRLGSPGSGGFAACAEIRMSSKEIKRRSAKELRTTMKYPHTSTDSNTGLVTVHCTVDYAQSVKFDLDVPASTLQDSVHLWTSAWVNTADGGLLNAVRTGIVPV